ncbi:hypothetical protein NEUTE1DRAFT_72679 [Neurospora tetrasperma FGSC 2508]|uniref:Uncharacterized protein n=1 Tax=Neurospora tetrasperma (strain FGSC 2508 / ATCC MYA-4615 / P0657) TaxID=510951 RepID=F8N4V3_NEUT8|nr:uncharacterized protein NEUTE1DRAFT_72679 [Neurospora tetrasperma FGSC 2508]EGO52737.1 hypothetical protein NEUTE1DRAFT_72679 [Neurospora tetrasperma FGSC 2508]
MSAGLVNSYLNSWSTLLPEPFCFFDPSSSFLCCFGRKINWSWHPKFLQRAVERVIRSPDDDEPSAEIELGTHMIRGDTVCLVGLVDEPLDESIDWTKVKGATIGTTKH